MKCFNCKKGKLSPKTTVLAGEVRGEKFVVHSEAMVCNRCAFQVLSDEQSAAYTVAVSDAYREKHGLLTSRELRGIRDRLGLSQRAFATYLKVSVASIKRWEWGLIQDGAHDQLMRLRTDLVAAHRNVSVLETCLEMTGRGGSAVEVSYHLRRGEVAEWATRSPSISGVPSDPGSFHGYCSVA